MVIKKYIIRIASCLFPKMITSIAFNKFSNPQVRKIRKNELISLEKSDKEKYRFKDFDIQLYTWKGGDKKIFLIHGWEGQAGNFSDLIEELLIKGFTIYSFDFPSHGYSSKGKTNLLDFTELIIYIIKKNKIKNLVSHSFGSLATIYALFINRDVQINKYVLLTTPDKFTEQIDYVSELIGINEKVKKQLICRIEKEIDFDLKSLNVSEFVKFINVKKSLVIHDKNDKVIPISRSKNVHQNWDISEFKEIEDTGHFRILRTKEVIDDIVNYFA